MTIPKEITDILNIIVDDGFLPFPTGSRVIGGYTEFSDWDFVINIFDNKSFGLKNNPVYIHFCAIINNLYRLNKIYKIDYQLHYSYRGIINAYIKIKEKPSIKNCFGFKPTYHKLQFICDGHEYDNWVKATITCLQNPELYFDKKMRVEMFNACGVSQWPKDIPEVVNAL